MWDSHHTLLINTLFAAFTGTLIASVVFYIQHRRTLYKHRASIAQHSKTQAELEKSNQQLHIAIARHEITENLLQETQDYLNSMINSMPSVLIGVTSSGLITHWNSSASLATGLLPNQVLNRHINDIYPDLPVPMAEIHKAIAHGVAQVSENVRVKNASATEYRDITVYPLIAEGLEGAVIRIDDVTNRVMLEQMMIQNDKMLSLGELAAGVAHELNNPLGSMIQNAQNLKRRFMGDMPANLEAAKECDLEWKVLQDYMQRRDIPHLLDDMLSAGKRATDIIHNMLDFSRSAPLAHSAVDINQLIRSSTALVENSLGSLYLGIEHYQVKLQLNPQLPSVPCNPSEIQQVLLNLLRNAAQAIGRNSAQPPIILISSAEKAGYVEICVEDNGPGMDEDTLQHLFEPFFTTKEVGEGTGLGLSVSYFILTEHHHGQLLAESELHHGSRFTLRLPLEEQTEKESASLQLTLV
ncbi:MAG: PAS domain S-box protein [Oceanospirillaceae bacterium]|nr:PAS domain S-box protein [Oceanospirillaceae bacterium]MCP5335289.1 PAS domain S-box protein [Oceanospirillaceae bacterium]MCP5350758.1 PAS domain S-box protein [Oceanospirillaceae bacterium]